MLNIWKKKSPRPTSTHRLAGKAYPISGIFYATEKGHFYVKSGKRYRLFSERCFNSWSVKAIDTDFSNISHIPFGGILGFRDGTIIHNLADGKIYIVSDNKKLHIMTPDAFPEGWIDSMKIVISSEEAELHKDGQSINGSS